MTSNTTAAAHLLQSEYVAHCCSHAPFDNRARGIYAIRMPRTPKHTQHNSHGECTSQH